MSFEAITTISEAEESAKRMKAEALSAAKAAALLAVAEAAAVAGFTHSFQTSRDG